MKNPLHPAELALSERDAAPTDETPSIDDERPRPPGLGVPAAATDEASEDPLDQPLPPVRPRRKAGPLTMVFAGLLMAGAGFLAGTLLQHRHDLDNPPATDNPFAALAAARAGGAAAGGTQGNGAGQGTRGARASGGGNGSSGASAAATTGTVKLVDGDKLYVQQPDGSVAKFSVAADTQIAKVSPAESGSLVVGQTVTVTGTGGSDDAATARAITVGGPAPTAVAADPSAAAGG